MRSGQMVRARLAGDSPAPRRESNLRRYLERLERRPKWAERYMRRVAPQGELAMRCLDGRFWMCLRAGFRPMLDEHWDWWRSLPWTEQQWFYEQGMALWQMERRLKHKRDPHRQLSRAAAKEGDTLR